MAFADISLAEMQQRTTRFRKLKKSSPAFADTRLPGHMRDIFNVIGGGVTYIGAQPGGGEDLHARETTAVFIPMTGRWACFWGENGDREIILDQFDCISVPPGVPRGFRNIGNEYAYLMAITGSREETGDGGQ